jgi:hypothetical protein
VKYPGIESFPQGEPPPYRSLLNLAGLPGKFSYISFAKRHQLFHLQSRIPHFIFYERHDSPLDLVRAVTMRQSSWRQASQDGAPDNELVISTFPSIFDAPSGEVPLPEAGEPFIGEHNVVVTHFDPDSERLHFVHSWGSDWGDNGTGSISIDYLTRFYKESWTSRTFAGPQPDVLGQPDLGPSEMRLEQLRKHSWSPPNDSPLIALSWGNPVFDVAARWLIGIDGAVCLQSVAFLNDAPGDAFIVGWMHVRATETGPKITELFVWPPHRERAIGAGLFNQTLVFMAATAWRDQPIQWIESEPDEMVLRHSKTPPRLPRWLKDLRKRQLHDPRETLMELLTRLAG